MGVNHGTLTCSMFTSPFYEKQRQLLRIKVNYLVGKCSRGPLGNIYFHKDVSHLRGLSVSITKTSIKISLLLLFTCTYNSKCLGYRFVKSEHK